MKASKITRKAYFFRHAYLKDVILFCLITLLIHHSFRLWVVYEYYPINKTITQLADSLKDIVFSHSVILIKLLPYDISIEGNTIHINDGFISINSSCSGLKQMLQAALLFLVFTGSWKHKFWFIPLSIIIMHISNLTRILILAIVVNHTPDQFDFYHDIVVRPLFYVVIFTLWIWWIEQYKNKKSYSFE